MPCSIKEDILFLKVFDKIPVLAGVTVDSIKV